MDNSTVDCTGDCTVGCTVDCTVDRTVDSTEGCSAVGCTEGCTVDRTVDRTEDVECTSIDSTEEEDDESRATFLRQRGSPRYRQPQPQPQPHAHFQRDSFSQWYTSKHSEDVTKRNEKYNLFQYHGVDLTFEQQRRHQGEYNNWQQDDSPKSSTQNNLYRNIHSPNSKIDGSQVSYSPKPFDVVDYMIGEVESSKKNKKSF